MGAVLARVGGASSPPPCSSLHNLPCLAEAPLLGQPHAPHLSSSCAFCAAPYHHLHASAVFAFQPS